MAAIFHSYRPGSLAALCLAIAAGVAGLPRVAGAVEWRPADRPPEDGGFTRSMGLPSPLQVSVGAEFLSYRPRGDHELGGLGTLSVSRILGNPTVGIASLGGDVYFGGRAKEANFGVRAEIGIPSLYVAAGADFDAIDENVDFMLRLEVPVRRGGVLGGGSMLQFRWLPTRDQTFSLGVRFPLQSRFAGKTRPPHDFVRLEKQTPERLELPDPDEALASSLDVVRDRAQWIARLSQPFTEESGGDAREAMAPVITPLRERIDATRARVPGTPALTTEIREYHRALDLAFSRATSAAPGTVTGRGEEVCAAARRVLLDDVVLPYNYLLGQRKRNDSLRGWIGSAQTAFGRWLLSEADVTFDEARACFWVFQTLCDIMEENRAELERRWEDERLVWLPLQYGFREEEYDTQPELDVILERATRESLERDNRIWYLINEQFQYEAARSVQAAEDYHVLWIHDIAGVNHHGEPDRIAFAQVGNYLETLARRVREYDETRKIPVYMIFLDQHYFEANHGQHWMRLLEDPLHAEVRLPHGNEKMVAELERLQGKLRQAVEGSLLLRLEHSQYGDAWLANRIKVHVSITNPSDFSFRSLHVVGRLPVPDNNMRDHRKILFYDLDEDDPYRGEAMFTGMGIGEHYVGSNWEDRALIIRGPGALPVKDAARGLLLAQGFEEEEIPWVLRPKPRGAGFERASEAWRSDLESWFHDWEYGVLQLHNDTGFTDKPINVAKAVLYSLMPAGSVLMIPDSLWQSHVYGSLLAGSSLRGCRSLIIAPTLASAPSSGWPQMARAHGLMARIVVLAEALDDEITAADGVLVVGLYNPRAKVADIAGRVQQSLETTTDWTDRVGRFHGSVERVVEHAGAQLDSLGYEVRYLSESDSLGTPKLHLKANFIASGIVWKELMAEPAWAGVVEAYIEYLARQQGRVRGASDRTKDVREGPEELRARAYALLADYSSRLSPEERAAHILYLTVGSTNLDYRSMIMNGEVQITLAGIQALTGVLDFALLIGLCDWVETPEQIEQHLAAPGWLKRRIASFVKVAL